MKKIRRASVSSSFFLQIPHEIITEILARIPAKTLLRCMAVCKLWRFTLCDPQFAEIHRRYSRTRIGGNYFASLLLYETLDKQTVTISFKDRRKYRRVPRPIELHTEDLFPLNKGRVRDGFRSLCFSTILDGLVCFYVDHASILNITTREVLHLPATNFEEGIYALGYDPNPRVKQYKVLHYGTRTGEPISEVFTIGSSSSLWRPCVKPPELLLQIQWPVGPGLIHRGIESTCVNGIIYWLNYIAGERILISFNVGKEVYGLTKISLPLDSPLNLFSAHGGNNLVALTLKFHGERREKKGIIEVWKVYEDDSDDNGLKAVEKKEIGFPLDLSFIGSLRIVGMGVCPTGEIVLADSKSERRIYYVDDRKGTCRFESSRFCSNMKTYHVENLLRLTNPSSLPPLI